MSGERSNHARAMTIAVFVTVLWSSSWVLIRWGLDDEALRPVTFAALRYGIAAVVLLGRVAVSKRLRASVAALDRRAWASIVVLGIVFYALTQGAQFVAIDSQPAATTSLVLSWTPLFVVLTGGSISETSTRRQSAGALLVIAGAFLYFSGHLGATVIGMAAAAVALSSNVGSALLGRRINRDTDIPPVVVTALSMTVGSSILVAVGVGVEGMPSISTPAWGIVGVLALVNTALAFTLWNVSLRQLSALESAAINNTMLIQIAALAWIFLGEPLGPGEILGIVLVSVGIFQTQTFFTPRMPRHRQVPGRRGGWTVGLGSTRNRPR